MDADSFTEQALRMISGEATADERRAFEAELAASPAQREEFAQLQATLDLLRTAAPMTEAMRAAEPALPAYRVNELRTAVRRHFGPEANRENVAVGGFGLLSALRWLLGGCGFAAVWVTVVLVCFSNRSVEVGLYGTDLTRGGDNTVLAPGDVPSARIVTFQQDAPFDQWQNRPLPWYDHAKLWVDNEKDLLHIVRRERHGMVVTQVEPLAPTNDGQREQIQRAVEALKN